MNRRNLRETMTSKLRVEEVEFIRFTLNYEL